MKKILNKSHHCIFEYLVFTFALTQTHMTNEGQLEDSLLINFIVEYS